MAILTIAKSSVGSAVRGRKRLAGKPIVPRGLIRFSMLLTIGMAMTTVVLTLFGMMTGDYLAIAAVGVMTIATWLAATLFIASLVILFRCLVVFCEGLLAAVPWRAHRLKLNASDVPNGITDEWLDGPF
jgi:hypothetical protein